MTTMTGVRYDIQRATGTCALTGRKLEIGEAYMATLVETDGEELHRLDFSLEAWAEQDEAPEGLFCFWKSVVPQPNKRKKPFVDDTILTELVKRLGAEQNPKRLAFRFVLMLLLMRKKLLRYDETVQRMGPALDWSAVQKEQEEQAAAQAEEETQKEAEAESQELADTETVAEVNAESGSDAEAVEGAEMVQQELDFPEPEPEPEIVELEYWVMTPKLDPAKGPMGKWATEQIEVLNPHLNEMQIQAVTEELSQILRAELEE